MNAHEFFKLLNKVFDDNFKFEVGETLDEDFEYLYNSEYANYEVLDTKDDIYFVLRNLEDEYSKAKRKLKKKRHDHKNGKIPINELEEYRYYIFDLECQIKELTKRLEEYE